jgi:DNA-binding MarR family transcriptional regulator
LLEQAGLVTRIQSRDDERSITVTITGSGRALLTKVFPGHIEVLSRLFFEPLTPADIESLADVLTKVRDHMRASPPRSASPRRRKTPQTDRS